MYVRSAFQHTIHFGLHNDLITLLFEINNRQYDARANDGSGRTPFAQATFQLLALLVTLCTYVFNVWGYDIISH